MAVKAFTDRYLESLRSNPRTKRYTVYEKSPRYEGFAVEVMPTGRLSFRYRYRIHGKREKVTIGFYPNMSLATARQRYREMVDLVHRGISPAEEKRNAKARSANTANFEDVAKRWIDEILRPSNKNSRQDETYLKRDILPVIGKMVPSDIDRTALWTCIEKVRSRGHGQAARRVRSVLKRVFDYALSRGMVIANPVAGIDPQHIAAVRHRDRVLTSEEIPMWLHAIETSSISKPQKLALRLLLLLPVRKGELLAAKWTDVDLENRVWDIPKENSKNRTPIRHRMSNQVTAIFIELQELSAGSEWVLPSSKGHGQKPLSSSALNAALRGINGLPPGMVIHDLRRTVRTYLAELGVSTSVAELCLNHRPTGVVGVYDRSELLDQRYEALLRWESHLIHMLTDSSDECFEQRELDGEVSRILDRASNDDSLRRYLLNRLAMN
ncbi:site-specific integrase [Oleiagrimonas soli]|uniref:Integrase n=1 Tax=Oleiagrimonas soli TaxID=1543381 RepID=A0A841KS62_9GAMM|nr:integrase [Oleiagrimonas soli]